MAMRHNINRARPHAFPHIALMVKGRGQFIQNTKDRFVKPNIHHLAAPSFAPRFHGQHGAHGTVNARKIIRDGGGTWRDRRTIRIARQIGKPTKSIANAPKARAAAIGPRLPIAGNPHHDQARIDRMQHIPANAPFFHCARLEILHQNIRIRAHALEQFRAFGLA